MPPYFIPIRITFQEAFFKTVRNIPFSIDTAVSRTGFTFSSALEFSAFRFSEKSTSFSGAVSVPKLLTSTVRS